MSINSRLSQENIKVKIPYDQKTQQQLQLTLSKKNTEQIRPTPMKLHESPKQYRVPTYVPQDSPGGFRHSQLKLSDKSSVYSPSKIDRIDFDESVQAIKLYKEASHSKNNTIDRDRFTFGQQQQSHAQSTYENQSLYLAHHNMPVIDSFSQITSFPGQKKPRHMRNMTRVYPHHTEQPAYFRPENRISPPRQNYASHLAIGNKRSSLASQTRYDSKPRGGAQGARRLSP